MMLLFDENLSYRLVVALSDIYPHSVHVRDVGLVGATDEAVWDYAIRHLSKIVVCGKILVVKQL